MIQDLLENQALLRKIYGVCPCCGELFRLSDLEIHFEEDDDADDQREEPDWLSKLENLEDRADRIEQRYEEREQQASEKAREKGRIKAARDMKEAIRKVDYVFNPSNLDPRDSKVMFHPVDFVVFDGLREDCVKRIVLLDRKASGKAGAEMQKNVAAAIKRKAITWETIHVSDGGEIEHNEE